MEAFIGTVMAVGFNYPPRGWLFCNGQLLPVSQNAALFALLGTMYGGDGRTTFGLPDLRGRVVVGSQAQGPGLQNVQQGEKGGVNNTTVISNGTANFTIAVANLPPHTHPATFTPAAGTVDITGLTVNTTVKVGTGTNGGTAAVANNGGLTNTVSGGQPSAAIFLPANTAPTDPVNLGGVSSSLGGTATASAGGTVTNGNTGAGAALTVPVVSSATISNMQPYQGLNYIICSEGIFPSRN